MSSQLKGTDDRTIRAVIKQNGDGMAVYAVSDLHGQYDTFLNGLEKIGFGDSDELYMVGDAIDRGPDGIRILQHIMDHDNMDLIIGNHEFMMLNAVDPNGLAVCNGPDAELWLYYNGGSKTYDRYERLSDEKRKSLLMWLNRRYVIRTIDVEERKFCLAHSYYYPAYENKMYCEMEYGDIWELVWTSVYRDGDTRGANIYRNYDMTFITGHVPVQKARYDKRLDDFNELKILEDGNLIDIDGGCALGYNHELTNGALFLRLDDMKVFPVPVPPPLFMF